MYLREAGGFTIVEILVTSLVTMFVVMGAWAIYVVGTDFYNDDLHHISVQRHARMAANGMLYGYGGEGLMEAETFNNVTATSVLFSTRTVQNCNVYYDNLQKTISYTDPNLVAPIDLTPPYVEAAGGVAVTAFNVSTADNERIVITFEVTALSAGADADNYDQAEVMSSVTLNTAATRRLDPAGG